MTDTLAAIRQLDLHICDCEGEVARGIVRRAIGHLEQSLQVHLTGPHTPNPARQRRANWRPYEITAPRPGRRPTERTRS